MAPLVDNPQIKSAELLAPLPLHLHAYVWPFAVVWPVFLAFYLSPDLYARHLGSQEWTVVWVGAIATLQTLVWLSTNWSVDVKALFTARRVDSVAAASRIKVVPIANAGASDICELVREKSGHVSFLFQKRNFRYDAAAKSFATLRYAIDQEPKPAIATFQASTGIQSDADAAALEKQYGHNTFDIPVPTFTELFREHAVAPFFVFQVFCVGLWLLDEYWYYSLFTLFMLVAFESTVVWQRQRTLTEFRGMSIKPYSIWVHRAGAWAEIQSDKLLPGDLVSVTRTKEDSGVACDMVLVEGTAIVNEAMLSGESTPLLKDSVMLRPGDERIDPEGLDKNAFLWGGTKVLQITHGSADEERAPVASGVAAPPDNGAMAVVLKTGFETSQGSLVRTMIYSTEHVSANNVEALFFILFLLVFAVAASWYVWDEGVRNDRKRSKLLLDCVLIVTSVVPPELPMQLSLSVNTALAALAKFAIFCTEPFRIPYAGRIDVACFDKTGTLTGEDLVVEGVAGLELVAESASSEKASTPTITPVLQSGIETTLVLATAHALVRLDEGEIVGDPMEKATLTSLNWQLGRNDVLSHRPAPPANAPAAAASSAPSKIQGSVHIKRRFQFSSALKRQSSVATVNATHASSGAKMRGTFVGVKGAPETVMKMLTTVPRGYEDTYKHFTRVGSRVLALAYKQLTTDSEMGAARINNLVREEVEVDLVFAGFLVLHCPLKEDAKEAVQMLNESSHRVVMITGDNPLTAIHVAREVEIMDRDALILDVPEHSTAATTTPADALEWRSIDETYRHPVDPIMPIDMSVIDGKDVCVTGHALARFKGQVGWNTLLRHTWVYARVSPKQKEDILLGLKDMGYYTLMAGDGTNDVGALKQAHIGVALLNGTKEDLQRIAEHARNTKMKELYQKQVELMKRFNQPVPPVPGMIAHLYPPGKSNPHHAVAIEREAKRKNMTPEQYMAAHGVVETVTSPAAQQLLEAANTPLRAKQVEAMNRAASFADTMQTKMMESEMEDEPPTLKLGDASVAAPFTSKLRDVMAIPNIIRQGRCTLVATIQMYKILALNCLITAYSLSVLYLEGIKFSDSQYTISGMLMTVCFMSLSRAKVVEGLSRERPHPNIFNVYIIGSILGQFAVHVTTLIFVARLCDRLEPRLDSVDLEAEFKPGLLNSGVYLLQLIQQISTFAVNYQGRPFREALSENRAMFWGIVGVSALAFVCSMELMPEINASMKLVPFTDEFRLSLTAAMALDYAACWSIEVLLKLGFSDFRPKDIAQRRADQAARERARKLAAQQARDAEEDRLQQEKVRQFEERLQQKKRQLGL
jgi:cation-transporting ATPase 13A1